MKKYGLRMLDTDEIRMLLYQNIKIDSEMKINVNYEPISKLWIWMKNIFKLRSIVLKNWRYKNNELSSIPIIEIITWKLRSMNNKRKSPEEQIK